MAKTDSNKGAQRRQDPNRFSPCFLKQLPEKLLVAAASRAVTINPANAPAVYVSFGSAPPNKERLAVLTSKYWGTKGVNLGVYCDTRDSNVKKLTFDHLNLWNKKGANVLFREASSSSAEVRIGYDPSDGHWSYLGTDILSIPSGEYTMNLALSARTSLSEWMRVVPHEGFHTCGSPHEHLRAALIALLDAQKTIAYFRRNYGWSEATTRSNVLTPLSDRSIMGTPEADEDSIMCYQISGECTKNGKPIRGGVTINQNDYDFANKVYPGVVTPPPPPPGELGKFIIDLDKKQYSVPSPEWTKV